MGRPARTTLGRGGRRWLESARDHWSARLELALRSRHRQPATRRAARRRHQVAGRDPRRGVQHDRHLRAYRGLLAVGADPSAVHYGYLALAIVGLVAAHAANNMINDYFDMEEGIDTDEYVRALYAPHPVLSGWLTKTQLRNAIIFVNAIDLAILLVLTLVRGPLVVVFALGRAVHQRLLRCPAHQPEEAWPGEPGVFLTWGR